MLVRKKTLDESLAESRQRRLSERRGRWAELLAALLLACKGYRILARRAKTPFGEIDLIARRGKRVAFVEVKYRKSFSSDARPINRRQAARIAKAAEYWLWRQTTHRHCQMGFDCILISRSGLLQHLPNALQPAV